MIRIKEIDLLII